MAVENLNPCIGTHKFTFIYKNFINLFYHMILHFNNQFQYNSIKFAKNKTQKSMITSN